MLIFNHSAKGYVFRGQGQLADKTYGLVVLGGEPLVRRDLAEILRYARERGIPSIRVATNGTLVKRAMEALRYVDRINVSLDGTRKHEFPEVVERMQRDICEVRQEMGRDFPSVCISYTLAQNDLFEQDILPVIRFARENGFDIKFLACKYPNNDVNWDFLRAVVERARGYVCDETLLNVRELTQKITNEFLFQNCLQGMQFYIDFEGYFLYPCDEYPDHRVGQIYEHSIDELYRMGVDRYGAFPSAENSTCLRCKIYCHAENSYNYRHPAR